MQLTYRGIDYKINSAAIATADKELTPSQYPTCSLQLPRLVWRKAIDYYVYRGVSYTKYFGTNIRPQ